jgi:hypothetical protein
MESSKGKQTTLAQSDAAFERTLNTRTLFFRLLCDDANPSAADVELDDAIGKCEEGVVAAYSDIPARMEFCATLANDDATGANSLAAVRFDSQTLGIGIPAIAC